jgi:hypothetical protein
MNRDPMRWLPLTVLFACADRLPPALDDATASRAALTGPVVSHDGLLSGSISTLAVDGAAAFDDVAFTVGRSPGAGPCPSGLGGLCLETDSPRLLGMTVADASGHAEIAWAVPTGLSGRTVALQAAIPRGAGGVDSVLTAVVQAVVDGIDADGDGFDATSDCDDADGTVHPGAAEVCDGVDTDCDAATTEDGLVSIGAVNYPTVGDAVWVAAPDATVNICAGTHTGALQVGRPVRLVGVAGAAATILDAASSAPVLDLDGVGTYLVEGLTLTGGTSGILVRDGLDLTVRNAVVTGNSSSASGSGIVEISPSWAPPTIRIEDSEISDNHCTTGSAASMAVGGGLYVSTATVTMDGAVFRDNSADRGGAAYLYLSAVTITGSTFHANASLQGDAGGLYVYSPTTDLVVVDSDFGTGAEENTPDDVFYFPSAQYTWFGAGESFTCSMSTNACQ